MNNMSPDSQCLRSVSALRLSKSNFAKSLRTESIAEEQPLHITIKHYGSLGLTLCSPGNLDDLVVGFLFTGGFIEQLDDILEIEWIDNNHCEVSLKYLPTLPGISANSISHSACGICRFDELEHLPSRQTYWSEQPIPKHKFFEWFKELQLSQPQFIQSGGLHASALFSPVNGLIKVREDIGRHNSMDKLIGSVLKEQKFDRLSHTVLLLSGRAGFELLQKAARSGIAIVAAIGAPSSLALDMARKFGITLLGFLKSERFNIYCHASRIEGIEDEIKDT